MYASGDPGPCIYVSLLLPTPEPASTPLRNVSRFQRTSRAVQVTFISLGRSSLRDSCRTSDMFFTIKKNSVYLTIHFNVCFSLTILIVRISF